MLTKFSIKKQPQTFEFGSSQINRRPTIGARVTNNAVISTQTGVVKYVTFNTLVYDTNGIYNAGSNTRLTCKTAGYYLIVGKIAFALNATGIRLAIIRKNGATSLNQLMIPTNPTLGAALEITTIADLIINDYNELGAYQNSGGNLNLDTSTPSPSAPAFMIHKLQ